MKFLLGYGFGWMGALAGDVVGLDWVGNLVRLNCNFVGILIWLGFGWVIF